MQNKDHYHCFVSLLIGEDASVVSSLGRPALHIDYALSMRSNLDIIHRLEMEVENSS